MRLSFDNHTVEIKFWTNKIEMIKFLESCDMGNFLLGEDGEQEKEFYSVVVRLDFSGLHCFGIGICSEGHGLLPHLLLLPDAKLLLLGFNREVWAINVKQNKIAFKIKLDSLFSSFWEMRDIPLILIFHEIGVMAINYQGKILWQHEHDIILDAEREGDKLTIHFIDKSSVCLNLSSSLRELQYL